MSDTKETLAAKLATAKQTARDERNRRNQAEAINRRNAEGLANGLKAAEAISQEAAEAFSRAYEEATGRQPETKARAERRDREAIDYGTKTRRRRQEANLSQVRLAELAGVTFATINRIERGRHIATGTTKRKIEAALRAAERKQKK